MKRYLVPFLFSFFTFAACNSSKISISEEYVKKIVKTLSSDEMRGRALFSPEIDKAADFLASEFSEIGLDKFPGLSAYRQDFSMITLTNTTINSELDGAVVGTENSFVMLDEENITWNENSDIDKVIVGEADGLPLAFNEALKSGKNTIIFVHPTHQGIFNRLKNYVSHPAGKFNLGKSGSIVGLISEKNPLKWSVTVDSELQEKNLANVCAVIPGKRADEIVLFSGHYDHIGILPAVDGDSIANGANDDASGVAAIMALAKYFKEKGTPERTLYFVAFTAEEAGGYGSQYFSEQLNPDHITAMFNIEMIGKPAVEGPNTAWITGFDKSNFGSLLQKSVEGTEFKFYPDPYIAQNLFYRSDNKTLARLGVPAHSISTTPIDVDKEYHQVTDHFETLDVAHMTNTVKAIAAGAVGIVSGEQTPTRIDSEGID